jgi:hypothetical protein
MSKAFKFKTELWIAVYTGVKVQSLQEFIEALRVIDIDSVFYHIYINMFNYHNMPVYYPNSFAYWLYKNNFLFLAEKLSSIDPLEISDLEELRKKILEILEKNYPGEPGQKLIPFYFVKAEREIIDCGMVAETMEEFIKGIKESSINSLFYHLVTSKIQKKAPVNDYSAWLLSIGETSKANLLSQIDVYNHTLYEIKNKIIKILEN